MNAAVEEHYTHRDLTKAIREALQRAGKDPAHLQPTDLAAVDEFHIRGRQATLELANWIKPTAADRVLDIGSGLGGASRTLAATYGCHVTGIDLTEAYCRTARDLAEWVGLGERVTYQQANALDLPFPDGSFDIAWTQHVAMNIPDKATLYREAYRVLKPGGVFALYDVLQGPSGEVIFPVPWAREPSISHLITPQDLRSLLEQAGFEVEHWQDTTAAGRDWFIGMDRCLQENGPPPVSFVLLMGSEFKEMAANQRRNLEENRIALIETVCRRR
ncbi:class I SAM-dependent methyltransferase [Microvirga sp. 17 mud 1-3]|uniref:class I SAM-dependent methyltransferase n=1 Tax=Microvirga sp. 17 mud 1-3 TaxID=2082949 RepID=UPI001AEC7FDC|nr:methyltransferase domain-containing protein [Microvirga sp. 17 mud 1-3]